MGNAHHTHVRVSASLSAVYTHWQWESARKNHVKRGATVNPNTDFDTDNASWDLSMSGLADFEAELSDLLDPDHFETEVAIDDQGNFLNWSDSEARLVSQPLPSRDAPLLAPASSDLLGFSEKGGFGLSPIKTSSKREQLNAKLKLDDAPMELKRGENLGMEDDLDGASLELDDLMQPAKPSASGFASVAAAPKAPEALADDLLAAVPMMDLFDAIEPQAAKPSRKTEFPSAPAARSAPAELAAVSLEPVNLEPVMKPVNLEPVNFEAVQPEPVSDFGFESISLAPPVAAPVQTPIQAPLPVSVPAPSAVTSSTVTSSAASPSVVTRLEAVVSSVPVMPAVTTLRRHFDATDLLEAQNKLVEVLEMPRVPLVIFLGRAAERCSSQLPNVRSIALAELRDEGLVSIHHLSAHDSFRKLLLEIDNSSVETAADLTIADLSDLELDEVVLPVTGPHLLLTKLESDPSKPGRIRGTLSLSGPVGLRSGAAFLKAVVTRLESPITLML